MKITKQYLRKLIRESIEEAQYEYSQNSEMDRGDMKHVLKQLSEYVMELKDEKVNDVSKLIQDLYRKVVDHNIDSYDLPSYSNREY